MWLLTLAAPALACSISCPFDESGLRLPEDGAEGVPLDALPVVQAGWKEAILLDAEGERVDADLEVFDAGLARLRPSALLAPDASYTVVLIGEGAEDEVLGSFVTGDRVAEEGRPPAVQDLWVMGSIARNPWPGACPDGDGNWIDVDWAESTGLYEVEAIREDGPLVRLVVDGAAAHLGSTTCLWTLPNLGLREDVEIRVRALDQVGRAGPWSAPLITSVRQAGGGCSTGGAAGAPGAAALMIGLLGIRRARGAPPC